MSLQPLNAVSQWDTFLFHYAGCEAFYLAVSPNPKDDVWYKASPMGIHSIESATKSLMSSLRPDEFVSNTSLRRTAMHRLIKGGIRKEIIQKKTGRVSDAADASYISATEYEKDMSSALYIGASKSGASTSAGSSTSGTRMDSPIVCGLLTPPAPTISTSSRETVTSISADTVMIPSVNPSASGDAATAAKDSGWLLVRCLPPVNLSNHTYSFLVDPSMVAVFTDDCHRIFNTLFVDLVHRLLRDK